MYRILAMANEVRERRDQLRCPTYTKPELLATRPNQLWSWDITKLKGLATWIYILSVSFCPRTASITAPHKKRLM